jgi:hypothetical protein
MRQDQSYTEETYCRKLCDDKVRTSTFPFQRRVPIFLMVVICVLLFICIIWITDFPLLAL